MSQSNKIGEIVGSIFRMDKFWDLFKGKEKIALELIDEINNKLHDVNIQQIKLNLEESKNKRLFVSGWRPFIGWVCGLALFYNYIAISLIDYVIIIFDNDFPSPDRIDLTDLWPILLGMLGLGVYRTVEKIKSKK